MDIRGDISVSRTGVFGRRADQGLMTLPALDAGYAVLRHSHAWLNVTTDDNGTQTVTLPDATTLPLGWNIVLHNIGAVDAIPVNDNAATLLRTLMPTGANNFAYSFTLIGNGTAAGVWYMYALDDFETQVAGRYVRPFNATTDWGTASNNFFSITTLQTAHVRGNYPIFQTFQTVGTDNIQVITDRALVNASGDVVLRVTSGDTEDTDTDARFAGYLVLI